MNISRKKIIFVLPALLVLALTIMLVRPSFAPITCPEGCTAGYWKNHLDSWVNYLPNDLVGSVFTLPVELSGLAGDTLLDALKYKGGNGIEGAARILLRYAVAALLNAAHPDVTFPVSEAGVIMLTSNFLGSLDRDMIIFKAGWFQAKIEWFCPLN